jgi:hypothetical protein
MHINEEQLIIIFHNELTAEMFEQWYRSFAGPMVTVLGTSLQNKIIEILP